MMYTAYWLSFFLNRDTCAAVLRTRTGCARELVAH